MNIFNKFSYKLFSVITTLFFYTCFNNATAVEKECPFQKYTTLTPCGDKEYLSHCDTLKIGTNWLKGIPCPECKDGRPYDDYYSYGEDVSDNIINLRKFFAGVETISYQTTDGIKTVAPEEYKKKRDYILNNFCKGSFQCTKCPNNANVPQTVIKIGNECGDLDLKTTHIYTIADCYMDEFSDHTGTYVYVPNSADINTIPSSRCYYSNDEEGSVLQ